MVPPRQAKERGLPHLDLRLLATPGCWAICGTLVAPASAHCHHV